MHKLFTQKYRKIKSKVHLIFETDLEKKSSQKNKSFKKKNKKKKKKKTKTLLQSYTPCLDSQSVKM